MADQTSPQQAKPGFFHTLPGLLTAIGGVIGSIVALLTALIQLGTFRDTQAADNAATAPAVLQVIGATARVEPALYDGRCPVTVAISAELRLSGAAGIVQYRWNWDGREDSDVRELQVQQGETARTVTAEVTLGGLGPRERHVQDAVAIEVISPTSLASAAAGVEVRCGP